METKPTERGFALGKFTDAYNVPCSIQESSACANSDGESYIWLGCDDLGLKQFIPNGNPAWRDVDLNEAFPAAEYFTHNTRMHLTQSQVRDLLPQLQHFADHGTLK